MTKKLNLGKFLSQEREKLNLSQQDLAKKCNIPAGTIASIESGYAKSPRSVTLKKLAEGLNISMEVLFAYASLTEFVEQNTDLTKIPILGEIPSTKELSLQSYASFPTYFIENGDFLLFVKEDTFIEEDIFNNDYIVVKKQDYLEKNGDLMVVSINQENTLARICKNSNGYSVLIGKYQEEMLPDNISFIGKALTSISRKKL